MNDDVWSSILKYLTVEELLNICLVSKYFNDYICNKKIDNEYIITYNYYDSLDKFIMLIKFNDAKKSINFSYDLDLTKNGNISNYMLNCLENITCLDFSCRIITDNGIKNITSLKYLNLSSKYHITNNALGFLTNLTTINLEENVGITDDGLMNLTKLYILDLRHNNYITDNGLKYLPQLKALLFT